MLSSAITEGEKRDMESKVSELETQKNKANQRAEELDIQNSLLEEQLKISNENSLI